MARLKGRKLSVKPSQVSLVLNFAMLLAALWWGPFFEDSMLGLLPPEPSEPPLRTLLPS